jgi:V/A-type H+-transporting ATPase subunit I
MIVRMRHLDLICVAADKDATLERLRALGAVHLDLRAASGEPVAAARGAAAAAEKAVRLILKARETAEGGEPRARSVDEILAVEADRETLRAAADELRRQVARYAPYGDFDPALAQKLLDAGVDLKSVAELPPVLPAMRLSKMREKLARIENRIAIDTARLAGCDEKALLKRYPELADRIAFASAKELMAESGAVACLSGWLAEGSVAALKEAARAHAWGLYVRPPAPGETPPTLIEPPKFFRPVKALFDGLGIAPAYVEADVSVPFMCYFSLFFAMLVGDGAYGAIFLAATLALRKKLPRSWLILLCVFSSATVLWGLLSNTWFGAQIPWCAHWPTVAWLGDPSYSNMMLLCFTIGASHLILARVWNAVCRINDTTCLAEFGWAGILLFMYFVTNTIVGIFTAVPPALYWVFGVSLVLVFGFTMKWSELKIRGAELGMLPLNIMSALGDIISYVRLFAVGLASVKVAENFNAMATGLLDGADSIWLKALMALLMCAILIVGHGLNLAMAGLSILVHAVRLNTLEFSNHKGVSWSGYAFNPFKKTKE